MHELMWLLEWPKGSPDKVWRNKQTNKKKSAGVREITVSVWASSLETAGSRSVLITVTNCLWKFCLRQKHLEKFYLRQRKQKWKLCVDSHFPLGHPLSLTLRRRYQQPLVWSCHSKENRTRGWSSLDTVYIWTGLLWSRFFAKFSGFPGGLWNAAPQHAAQTVMMITETLAEAWERACASLHISHIQHLCRAGAAKCACRTFVLHNFSMWIVQCFPLISSYLTVSFLIMEQFWSIQRRKSKKMVTNAAEGNVHFNQQQLVKVVSSLWTKFLQEWG